MFTAFVSCRDGRYVAAGIDAHPQSSLTLPAEKCLSLRSILRLCVTPSKFHAKHMR